MINLSIIIPVYNEINHLNIFVEKLLKSFDSESVEYIFVNDGSNDGSGEWLLNFFKKNTDSKFKLKNLSQNSGKGNALHEGIKISTGKYLLFQDADLELNTDDSLEMLNIIKNNNDIECIFGSRYLSNKLVKNTNFIHKIVGKLNTIIFNLLFSQSLTDLHCGTKIISKKIIDNLNLSIKDFGFEIDIASQIAKNNYDIYEYGISYLSRTKKEGKKITWIDGIKSYYYLFKTRFLQNNYNVNLSIIFCILNTLYIVYNINIFSNYTIIIVILSIIIGVFIGLYRKILSSLILFSFCYLGIIIDLKYYSFYLILILFLIGIFLSKKISSLIKLKYNNKLINFLF